MVNKEQIKQEIVKYNAKCKLMGVVPLHIEITGNNVVAFGSRFAETDTYIVPKFVTAIGTNAFYSCLIEKMVIPENINHIDKYAFENCRRLKSVIIKANITELYESMFNACRKLKHVELPEGIKEIGERAFYDCESIEEIKLPSTVESIEREAFMYCESLKEIKLPEGIKEVVGYPFKNCHKLEAIYVPKSADHLLNGYSKVVWY